MQMFDLSSRTVLAELISSSTCHGISNIVNSRHIILKITWGLLFLTASFIGSYLIILDTLKYLMFQYIIKFSSAFSII